MSKFSERLEELIFDSHMNIKMFAEAVGINASSITNYLHDVRTPSVEYLVKIADFFHRSTDFLLGREEENKNLTFKTCPPFSQQIIFLKEKFKCTAYYIYHGAGIPKSGYYDWRSGKHQPTVDNIVKLAKLFDTRVDFILGRES